MLGQRDNRGRDRVPDGLGTMPGQGWPVLEPGLAVAFHTRQPVKPSTRNAMPASSLAIPRAIAAQNRRCSSRRPTGGRPGERIGGRHARSAHRR